MRVDIIGHFKPCTTVIFMHVLMRAWPIISARTRRLGLIPGRHIGEYGKALLCVKSRSDAAGDRASSFWAAQSAT
eukprot:COSAG05_NODE_764_length_7477_cov_18.431553_4_plen_75_part_00